VGAGGLGRSFSALVARAGHPTVLVSRPPGLDELLALGQLEISGLRDASVPVLRGEPKPGSVVLRTPGEDLPAGSAVLFTTKAHQLADAARAIAGSVAQDDTFWAAGLQNGLTKEEVLADVFGVERVCGASTVLGARRTQRGALVSGLGTTYVGEMAGGTSDRVDEAVAVLSAAGVPSRIATDIVGVLWAKLCNAIGIFGISALSGLPTREFMSVPSLVRAYRSLVEEVAEVAEAEGVGVGDYEDLPIGTYLRLPVDEMVALVTSRVAETPPGPEGISSMLQDLTDGRPTEYEEVFGDFLLRAVAAGVDTPRTRLVYEIIAGMDPGRVRLPSPAH
jgi:2-dehydropantoate 2-reductase